MKAVCSPPARMNESDSSSGSDGSSGWPASDFLVLLRRRERGLAKRFSPSLLLAERGA